MQVSDDLYLGNMSRSRLLPAFQSAQDPTINQGIGPMGRIAFYNIVPATKGAATLVALHALSAGTPLPLHAGAGITAALAPDGSGKTVYQLDVPRALSFTSTVDLSAINVTVSGFDYYGQAVTQTLALGNNTTVNTLKAFASVLSVVPDTTNAGTITGGTADIFGLPFAITDAGYIMPKWKSVLAQDGGTFVAAVTTDPNTAALGDVRGTYAPSDSADGSKRLVVWMHLTASQVGPNATVNSAIGVVPA